VEMGVMVDEPGRDDAPCSVDRPLGGGAVGFADADDFPVLDGNIRLKRRLARTVYDAPVFNEQIIRHLFSSLCPSGQKLTRRVLPSGIERSVGCSFLSRGLRLRRRSVSSNKLCSAPDAGRPAKSDRRARLLARGFGQ